MKKIGLLLVLLLGLVVFASCKMKEDTFIVGLECEYPPFNWVENTKSDSNYPISNLANSYAQGYDVQIAIKLANTINKKLVIKMISWDGLIPALNSKEIDAIVAGMSPTDARKEVISFTDAYYETTHVAVVRSDSTIKDAITLEELSGTKGVGQAGTVYADLVDFMVEEYGCTKLPDRSTAPLCINNVLFNEADFTILEKPVALGYVSANPDLTMIFGNIDNIFGLSYEDRVVSIGVRKSDTSLLLQLNDALGLISVTQRETMMALAVNASSDEE